MGPQAFLILLGAAALSLAAPQPPAADSAPISEASAKAIFEHGNPQAHADVVPNIVKVEQSPVHPAPRPSSTNKLTISRIKLPHAATPIVNKPGVPDTGAIAVSLNRSVPLADITHENFLTDSPSDGNFTIKERQACQYANCCPDPRYLNENTAYPWSVMGLWQEAKGTCSGTLVGPRHVLVASHCINWSGVNTFSGTLSFLPDYWPGHSIGTYTSSLVITYDSTPQVEPTTAAQYAFDFVVAVLDSYPNLGWMGSKTYSTAWNGLTAWYESGYAGNKGGGVIPYAQNNFKVTTEISEPQNSDILEYTACASPGDSGSSVFGWWSDGPYLVGLITQGSSSLIFGPGGPNVPNLINSARTNHP